LSPAFFILWRAQQGLHQILGGSLPHMDFGVTARARRRALRIRIRVVARAIQRAPSHVSNIERGVTNGSADDRRRIDAFLLTRELPLLIPGAAPRRGQRGR
jgi:transcriptional regulator with XRE-family HTH domain